MQTIKELRQVHFAQQRILLKMIANRAPGWRQLMELDKMEKRKAINRCILKHAKDSQPLQFNNIVPRDELKNLCDRFGIEV